jgi:signal transduction histidine kinase/CheY-like chemotaxis protein
MEPQPAGADSRVRPGSAPWDLINVVRELSFRHDVGSVMNVLKRSARQLTGADGITVVLRDDNQCYYADEDAISPLWKGKRFPLDACISGWCMIHREQVAITDIYSDDRIPHDAYRPTFVKSLAMTPIRSTDPIGAIGAYWAESHEPSTEELEILAALGDAASTAFANVSLFDSLKEEARRKDEFLLMLAHELRNPLVPIRNGAHVLKLAARNYESSVRAYEMVERQMRHMSRIVDDLLDVSRIKSGKVVLEKTRVDLGSIVRQAVADHRSPFEAEGLTLVLEGPQTPVWVQGDEIRLAQVVTNLLDNARKFTERGGLVRISLEAHATGSEATLKVSDTGIGISPDVLPTIFDPFTQADRSLARTRGGLGMGLSVVKGFVELHDGKVSVESRGPGEGTEVTVTLPRQPEPSVLAPAEENGNGEPRKRRVLVVEDNRDSADTLCMVLSVSGYEVDVAYTGTDGLAAAQSRHPDAVICDIGLPGMNGYEIAMALRSDPANTSMHLIAVTGYGGPEDRKRALEAGFDVHLVKPVPPTRLLSHLA